MRSKTRETQVEVISAVIFLVAVFWRAPSLLMHPSFWAEEATHYWAHLREKGFFEGLFFIFNGNLQIVENFIVKISTMVPIRFAAFPTTYISLLLAVACCISVCKLILSFRLPAYSAYMFSAMFALMPVGYEIFLNATNAQWVAAIIVFVLCFEQNEENESKPIRYVLIFLLGLSGLAACLTIIAYATWFVVRPTVCRFFSAIALLGACAIEVAIMLSHREQVLGRAFRVSPDSLIAYVFQAVFTDVSPSALLDSIGAFLRATGDRWESGIAFQLVLIGLASVAFIGAAAAKRLPFRVVAVMIFSSFVITLINVFGAIGGGADTMISGYVGGRYFALANTCTIILLSAGISAQDMFARYFARTLSAIVLCNLIWTASSGPWTKVFVTGESVGAQVAACGQRRPCHILVRPGDFWTLDLK